MKNNNINKKILIGSFLSLIILPTILYRFVPEELKKNNENRTLATRPTLNIDNYYEYSALYENYYNDNIPFKNSLVRLNSLIKFKLFDQTSSESVIKGKDGWLFYNSKYKNDGDTIADYQGTNKYTQDQLEKIAKNLKEKKKYLEEKGIEFCLFIAPNKSQIYYEYMPDTIFKNENKSKCDELVEYLKNNTDINVVYPKDELLSNKDSHYLYSKIDTHWNAIGGYIGFVEFMKTINSKYEYKNLEELKIVKREITSGDLSTMINLNGKLGDIYYEINNFKDDIDVKLTENKGQPMNRYVSSNKNGKKILSYRDSFAIKMIPYIVKEFEESAFVWGEPFNKDQIESENPDIVLLEVVERNIDKLLG